MENRTIANIKVLQDAISNRKLVVFAGAGVSVDAGVPGWSGLIDALRKDISVPYDENDYLKIAQMYYNERQEKEYTDKIRNVLGVNNATYTGIHKGIFNLKPEHVITTNYDNLLEQVIKADALPYSIIKNDSDFPFSLGTNLLVKMHGDINSLDMVLKEDDYLEYSNTHPLIESFIKSVFSSKVVLFVGYSFSDINLKVIVQTVRNILGKNFQMAYLFSSSNEIHESQRKYLQSKGINVIAYNDGYVKNALGEEGKNYFTEYVRNINKDKSIYNKESIRLSDSGKRLYDFLLFLDKFDRFKEEMLNKNNIIPQLDLSLSRFNEIACIPSLFLSSIYPFRSSEEEETYHIVRDYTLASHNKNLNDLFYSDIKVCEGEVVISNMDYPNKEDNTRILNNIVKKLNNSLIFFVQGEHRGETSDDNRNGVNIQLNHTSLKRAPLDHYFGLEFNKCLSKVATMSITQTTFIDDDLSLAYINYKLGNYDQCLDMLDSIANKAWQSEKYITYFIAKQNMITLYNFIKYNFDLDDIHINDLLTKIDSIQLNDLIIKLTKLDKDQREFVMQLKDKNFIRIYENDIRESIDEIYKVMWLYNSGGGILLGESHHNNMEMNLRKLFQFLTFNNIIHDEFHEFRVICNDAMNSLIISLSLSDQYKQKAKEVSEFMLLLLIHYCDNKKLREKMKQVKIEILPMSKDTIMRFVPKVLSLLKSNHTDAGLFNIKYSNPKTESQLNKSSFEDKYSSVFNNVFLVLASTELNKEIVKEIIENLKTFLLNVKTTKLFKFTPELSRFLRKHYTYLDWVDIFDILKVVAKRVSVRESDFIYSIYFVAMKRNMTEKINDITVVDTIINFQKNSGHTAYLVYMWYLSDHLIKEKIKIIITDVLDTKFDEYLYYLAADEAFSIIDKQAYLDKVIELAVGSSPINVSIDDEHVKSNALRFTNLVNFAYSNSIDLKSLLTENEKYSYFQNFLIDPKNFDYTKFNPEWLDVNLPYSIILKINAHHDLKPYVISYIKDNSKNTKQKRIVDKLRNIYFEALI